MAIIIFGEKIIFRLLVEQNSAVSLFMIVMVQTYWVLRQIIKIYAFQKVAGNDDICDKQTIAHMELPGMNTILINEIAVNLHIFGVIT